MIKFKVEGIEELNKKFKKIGSPPQKTVTKAARMGMSITLRNIRGSNAWIDDTGEMRKGLKLIGEKSQYKSKKVYQVVFDRAKNDVFRGEIKNPVKGKQKTYYYPASQNYGYYLKNGQYMPGAHFMEESFEESAYDVSIKIMKVMNAEIEKIFKGGG